MLDTAPTGHTLRMLSLPDFLREFIRKVKLLREKMGGVLDQNDGQNSGSGSGGDPASATDRLTRFERNMEKLEDMLHSPRDSEFVVVTIPTEVAVAETKVAGLPISMSYALFCCILFFLTPIILFQRLMTSLGEENIFLRRVIINQIINDPNEGAGDKTPDLLAASADAYLNRVKRSQDRSLTELVKISKDYNLNLIKIPYFDMEVRSIYGLRFVGDTILKSA